MTNNTQLAEKIKAAAWEANEWVWELPMWKEYREKIEGENADVKNIGAPGEAGTIAGGMFLQEFVSDTPWVHLDIAGTAWNTKPKPYMATGATGVGVRLVTEFLKKA
jgi:leucyl aminopeptidase